MTNPYQSSGTPEYAGQMPQWYLLLQQLYWPLWLVGSALIACSWLGIVSQQTGWVGFAIAGLAALGSYVLPSIVGGAQEHTVVLDTRLLHAKNSSYTEALDKFSQGAMLLYDGVYFAFRPNNELACGIAADSVDISQEEALEVADHAYNAFDTLCDSSPRFASLVAGHSFRISIMSDPQTGGTELFRVINREIHPRD